MVTMGSAPITVHYYYYYYYKQTAGMQGLPRGNNSWRGVSQVMNQNLSLWHEYILFHLDMILRGLTGGKTSSTVEAGYNEALGTFKIASFKYTRMRHVLNYNRRS